MIRATFTPAVAAADGDPGARTVAGVAVPWDVAGTVADGTRVVFHAGSLDASSRPVLLRDHDAGRPLGRVIAATDNGAAMTATARVARTRDGDEALVLAAPPDQVLGMFSVGADPTDWNYDQAGVMHVYAADWRELSLLTMGAYNDARVATVTATAPTPPTSEETTMTDLAYATDVDPDNTDDDDDGTADVDTDAADDTTPTRVTAGALVRRTAAPAIPLRAGTGPARPSLDLRGLSAIISAGKRKGLGGSAINARIQAALTNVTSTDIPGFVRPAYRTELLAQVDHGMPLVRALQSRPLPASGMSIEFPRWNAPPDNYAIQAAEKTQIATGAVSTTVGSVDIETWAQGNDISFQALNRSDPSFVEAYLRAAAVDAGRKYDTHVATALLASAGAATPGTDFVSNVQALFAKLDPNTTPAGPMFLAVSYDQAVDLIGVTGDNGPAFWSVSLNLGDFTPNTNAGGLLVFSDWNLPVGTMLLGSRQGATTYGGPDTSTDVRVVDVSLLGIDIGVYFYAALAIEYPGAFAKLTGLTAVAAGASSGKQSK